MMTVSPPIPAAATARAPSASVTITDGVVQALLAYDVGLAIDLDTAEKMLRGAGALPMTASPAAMSSAGGPAAGIPSPQRETIKHPVGFRRTPEYFEFRTPPLRIDEPCPPIAIGQLTTQPTVEIVLFDFGAVSVTYRIPLQPGTPLEALLMLSDALYENASLAADARRRVEALVDRIRPAIRRPRIADVVEDYVIFHIRSHSGGERPPLDGHRELLARVLRAEPAELSSQELADALSCTISYGTSDAAIIDWNASIVFQREAEDVLSVLEFANVELLEMRFLDDRLDTMLDRSYDAVLQREQRSPLASLRAGREEMRRIAALQMDSALLFESINNSIKLLGDQYLARVYRLAAQRLHLPEWDASILRKIQTLQNLYDKMNDERATRRMEFLEIVIIVLIAVSIVLPFVFSWAK